MIESQLEQLVLTRPTGKNRLPCFDQGPWFNKQPLNNKVPLLSQVPGLTKVDLFKPCYLGKTRQVLSWPWLTGVG